MILRKSGRIDTLGSGGLPIGLLPDATFERIDATLEPGDRLVLLSDGVTECPNPSGTELGENGLEHILRANYTLDSPALLEAVVSDLMQFHGASDFPDDVSGVVFDFTGCASS